MEHDDLIAFAAALPGVWVMTADESGAPEVAWGDSSVYYDPDDERDARRMPCALRGAPRLSAVEEARDREATRAGR